MHVRKIGKKALCGLLAAGMLMNTDIMGGMYVMAEEERQVHEILVDGDVVDPVNTFKGFGAVTCNNTSRLLMDYKEEHPDKYWEIMELLFHTEKGAGLNHIKVEMGGDVNSSSGTEPATMRSPEEEADVLRGAGWHFAADAKLINPDITVEILRWGEPKWTQEGIGYETDENPKHEARYQWYKQTIDAVFDEYGYKIDYVSPGQNERIHDYSENTAWIKYCANRLNEDAAKEDAKYDYSQIQIVAADTHSNSKDIANRMLSDSELMELVDVVSDHYTLYGNDSLTKVNRDYGKEVWYSEAIAPMINAKYRINVDANRGGVGGKVGMADLATRFINSYCYADAGDNPARMTRFEFQPAVGSFYEGSAYSPKQLIGAFDPWSGYYDADGGLQMVAHFMGFAKLGWNYLPDACYGDGSYTDGGVNADTGTNNYMTVKDPETDDYSTIFANNTAQVRKYKVTVKNLKKAYSAMHVWETRGPDEGEAYDANWMQLVNTITPSKTASGTYTYYLTVQPYSIATVTSLLDHGSEYSPGQNDSGVERAVLELPYRDDFEYSEYDVDENGRTYLERRGGTPRYTTDQYGAFEVQEDKTGNHVLTQMINSETRPYDWNVWGGSNDEGSQSTGRPDTVLGDHRWTNYVASIDFKLDTKSAECYENYAGLGVREMVHNGNKAKDMSTYTFRVFKDGSYELYCRKNDQKETGSILNFDASKWHNMKVSADENIIAAYVDGVKVTEFTDEAFTSMSGRISIASGFYNTQYDNLEILPIQGKAAFAEEKLDDTSAMISWSGNWNHVLNEGYAHYNRTRTYGGAIEKGIYAFNHGQIRYYKGGNPLAWSSNSSNAWGGASDRAHYELDFFGTGIEIFGEANSSNGSGNVFIDGTQVGTVNYNRDKGGTGHDTFDLGLDPTKVHTLKVEAESSYISLTKLKVIGEPSDSEGDHENSFTIGFHGTGFQLFGSSGSAVLRIEIDGKVEESAYTTPATGNRETSYSLQNLPEGEHVAKVTVTAGTFYLDGIDLLGTVSETENSYKETLGAYLSFIKKLTNENGKYSESDWAKLLETITLAEQALAEGDEARVLSAYLGLRNQLDSITPEVAEAQIQGGLTVVTVPFVNPVLPESVDIVTNDESKKTINIQWDVKPSMFTESWQEVVVTGESEDGRTLVKATVEVLPDKLVYFIDSGYKKENGSAEYNRISQYVDLNNNLPDQTYTDGDWGYVKDGIAVKGYSEDLSKTQTGIYAGNPAQIVYKLPMEAGTYEFTGAFREWWGMTRYMKVTVAYKDAGGQATEQTLGEVTLSSGSPNKILSGAVNIPVAGEVEYRVTMPSGSEKPVISWLAVNEKQEGLSGTQLGLPVIAVKEELPETVMIMGDEEEIPVTWKLKKGDWKKTGSVVELQGTLKGSNRKVSWKPVVYSPTQVYFVDCGSESVESAVYEAVKTAVPGLTNQSADQEMQAGELWGYDSEGLSFVTPATQEHGVFATGAYGNSNAAGSSFSYQVTLDEGDYDVTTGHTEWWATNNRTTQVKAVYSVGGEEKTVVLGSAGWNTGIQWTEGYVQGHLSIPEDETQVTLVFNAMTEKAPVVSYISIEEGDSLPISRIKVEAMPNKTIYAAGEEFNATGIVVNGYNRDQLVREISVDELEIDGMDTDKTGSCRLTLTYTNGEGKELKTSIRIVIYNPDDMYADSIKVVKAPDKTVYSQDESFDPAGMEVRMILKASDSNAIPAQAVALEEGSYQMSYDFTSPGKDKEVSVIYTYYTEDNEEKELSDTVKVTVYDDSLDYKPERIFLSSQPKKTVYLTNEPFETEGMEVKLVSKASQSNADKVETISDYVLTEPDTSTPGNKKAIVTYSYEENSFLKEEFPVTVTENEGEVKAHALDVILADMKAILADETTKYRTTEEKQVAGAAAVQAVEVLLQEIADPDKFTITSEIIGIIGQIEKYFEVAYPEITSRTIGDSELTDGAEIIGAKLNADLNSVNQVVSMQFTKTALPEDLMEGRIGVAMDISLLTARGEIKELGIPLQIKMKIPKGLSSEELLIMHYREDGKTEVIVPDIKDGMMTFAVTGFSTFVVSSKADVVEHNLLSIKVTHKPWKLNYKIGEEFLPDGMKVMAIYENESTREINDYTISGFDSSSKGEKTVMVSYEGQTDSFPVTVAAKAESSKGSSSRSSRPVVSDHISGTWKLDHKGWWYEKTAGGYLKGEWGKISGKWYYFDAEGYMMTGWIKDKETWYFMNPGGVMVANDWTFQNGSWYYLKSDGAMAAAESIRWNGNDYYLKADGTYNGV